MITREDIDKSISFEEYYQLVEQLAKSGGTSGENKSEALINYTKLNYSRMKRLVKTTAIAPEVLETEGTHGSGQNNWLLVRMMACFASVGDFVEHTTFISGYFLLQGTVIHDTL